jgi:Domain of unknown function (DUF6265)
MRSTLFYLILLFFWACGGTTPEHHPASPFELNKLVGRWESVSKKNSQVEEWTKVGENELTGKGYVLDKGDTTFIEYLRLAIENDVLTYFAMVGDQNDRRSIPFKLTENKRMKMTFENPSHDFPQVIVYEMINDTMLTVFVEGNEDGIFRRIKFDFEKK